MISKVMRKRLHIILIFPNQEPGTKSQNFVLTPPDISLEPNSIQLREVVVRSFRNTKTDSIKNRKDFAEEFAYRPTGFKDIFVMKSPEESMYRHIDVHRGNNPYSASSTIKLDVLSIVNLLSRNKTAPGRLRKNLVQDEVNRYVNQAFSKEKIIALTKLSGDCLNNFMIKYQPSAFIVGRMTDYDMIAYIKRKYLEYSGSQQVKN